MIGGLTYNYLPFMILPIYVALERVDPRLVEAAYDLYATPVAAFRKVIFPLSLPGVFAGVVITFVPVSSDYVNAHILGGPSNTMIGNVIQNQYLRYAGLSDRVGAVVHPDGGPADRHLRLRAGTRHRGRAGGGGPMTRDRRSAGRAGGASRARAGAASRDGAAIGDRLLLRLHLAGHPLADALPIAVMIVFSFNNTEGPVQHHLGRLHHQVVQLERAVRVSRT